MPFYSKSLRWRLLAWQGLILSLVVIGLGVVAYKLEYTYRLKQVEDELQRRSFLLANAVPPGEDDLHPPLPYQHSRAGITASEHYSRPLIDKVSMPPEIARLYDSTNGFYYFVWLRDGRVQARSDSAPKDLSMPARQGPEAWRQTRIRGNLMEYIRFTTSDRCFLLGCPIDEALATLRRFAWILGLASGGVLLLGLAGGWWVATRAMKPIENISATATRISAGNLSERINVEQTDNELGQLAGTLNSTFARLEQSFSQQKQFTADASHELRTPLAVMISEAQTTLARDRTAAEYRETVEACLETAQQMRRLTEALLELARFDASEELQRQPFDLTKTVRSCIDLIHPLADARTVKIISDLSSPVVVSGDSALLHQVVTNLLTNGIHYNKPAGEVWVHTHQENGNAILKVTDTGKGIAPEDLPHIFKRFYRADKARARADGRYGLGLAICKSIINLHGGRIEAKSEPGNGTTFTVRLPSVGNKA